MAKERVLVVGRAGISRGVELIAHCVALDDVGTIPVIELKPQPAIPEIKIPREPKKRDWEQRNRKRR